MFSDFLEKICDLFSDGGSYCNHDDCNDIVSGLEHSGVDLSMYSADEIKEALKAAIDGHSSDFGHEIAFGAAPDVDARNLAKSSLITELDKYRINTISLSTDELWGGLDSYSGDKVYDAINNARDNDKISASVYDNLIALLKKACHTQ